MSIPKLENLHYIKFKFAITLLLLLMSIAAWNTLHRYNVYKELIYHDVDHLLYSTAMAGAKLLGADFHNNLHHQSSVSADQQINNEHLMNILANSSKLHYIYSVYEDHGVLRFATSSNTPEDYQKHTQTHYYDTYLDASPKLKHALKVHTTAYDEYTDRWGTFRSVYIPLQSSNGTWYAMCADMDLHNVTRLLDNAFWEFIIIPSFLLILIGGVGFYYIRLTGQSLHHLNTSNRQLYELRLLLEKKVTDKSHKNTLLKGFNASLEHRVHKEIEKSRQAEHHMLQQSRLAQLGEMVSMIAHQWRQPLAAIGSNILDLKLKLSLNSFNLSTTENLDECIAYINSSLENVEHHILVLTNTIDDFRDFYKSDKRSNMLPIEHPIQKAVTIIKSSCTENKITISEQYHAKHAIAMFDGELIQVFLSILKNAQDNFIQKSTQNPVITITTYHIKKNGVGVTICDNGGGIPEEIIEKIFDPYFSTKEELNGTGLGLYMSKIIVEEHHNGTLLAYNTQDGVCFKIELEETRI